MERDFGGAKVVKTWENLPDEVHTAVMIKRNTARSVILLPRTHWELEKLE